MGVSAEASSGRNYAANSEKQSSRAIYANKQEYYPLNRQARSKFRTLTGYGNRDPSNPEIVPNGHGWG